jgi:hypothetical protein
VCVSFIFFVYRIFGRFLVRGVQKHHIKLFTKNQCQNKLQRIDKNPNAIFSRFFSHIFWRFSVRGVRKRQTNITKPCYFFASDPPTRHGGVRFFFATPWRGTICTTSLALGAAEKKKNEVE